MERRHIEWQIRAIRVMLRIEGARLDGEALDAFRARAVRIVDRLEPLPMDDDLRHELSALRQELRR